MTDNATLAKRIADLERQLSTSNSNNQALAAQIESVVNAFTDATNTPEMQAVGKILKEAFGGAPQQHLAEIRAQDRRDGFVAGYEFCLTVLPSPYCNLIAVNYKGMAERYADSIRQGGAE